MKKIVSVFLMLFLIMGIFAGCGDNAESESPIDGIQNPVVSNKENNVQEELLPLHLVRYGENVWIINRYNEDLRTYSNIYQGIDVNGNVLFELHGQQGVYPKAHELNIKNGVFIFNETIYDKEGKVIASPEKNGYEFLATDNTYEYILAGKIEQSFEGDMYHFGVLDIKGQWVHPLSKDNQIAKIVNDSNEMLGSVNYYGNNTIDIRYNQYYNLKNNSVTDNYVHVYDEYNNLYRCDEYGNETVIEKNVKQIAWKNDIKCYRTGDERFLVYIADKRVVDLPQSSFDVEDITLTKEDKLLILARNKNNANYIILIDKDGNMIGEPTRIDDKYHPMGICVEYGVVCYEGDNRNPNRRVYIDHTGKITEIPKEYKYFTVCGNEYILATYVDDISKATVTHVINTNGEVVIK